MNKNNAITLPSLLGVLLALKRRQAAHVPASRWRQFSAAKALPWWRCRSGTGVLPFADGTRVLRGSKMPGYVWYRRKAYMRMRALPAAAAARKWQPARVWRFYGAYARALLKK
ncbi:hypothetical protein NPIL_323901, partial [Nephila pilipes]